MQKIKSNPLKTNLTICLGLNIIYFFSENSLFIAAAVIVGSVGLISAKINFLIEKCWFLLAKILGYIVPNIILTLIFFLFLFPISLLQKLFLSSNLNFKNSPKSNYITTHKMFSSKDLKYPW